MTKKLDFQILDSSEPFSRAVRIIEVRNLLVHNRGIVNRIFHSRTGDSSLEIGSLIKLTPRSMISDLDFLAKSVLDIDERAPLKFSLARSKSEPKVTKRIE